MDLSSYASGRHGFRVSEFNDAIPDKDNRQLCGAIDEAECAERIIVHLTGFHISCTTLNHTPQTLS